MYIKQEQAAIKLKVDGVSYGDGNSWFSLTGGALASAGSKTRPGAMGKEIELGGLATRADVTIEIQNSDIMVGQHRALEGRIGKGNAIISVQYLDDEGKAIPNATWSLKGKLKDAHLPETHTDQAAVGMYQVIVACDEVAA